MDPIWMMNSKITHRVTTSPIQSPTKDIILISNRGMKNFLKKLFCCSPTDYKEIEISLNELVESENESLHEFEKINFTINKPCKLPEINSIQNKNLINEFEKSKKIGSDQHEGVDIFNFDFSDEKAYEQWVADHPAPNPPLLSKEEIITDLLNRLYPADVWEEGVIKRMERRLRKLYDTGATWDLNDFENVFYTDSLLELCDPNAAVVVIHMLSLLVKETFSSTLELSLFTMQNYGFYIYHYSTEYYVLIYDTHARLGDTWKITDMRFRRECAWRWWGIPMSEVIDSICHYRPQNKFHAHVQYLNLGKKMFTMDKLHNLGLDNSMINLLDEWHRFCRIMNNHHFKFEPIHHRHVFIDTARDLLHQDLPNDLRDYKLRIRFLEPISEPAQQITNLNSANSSSPNLNFSSFTHKPKLNPQTLHKILHP